MSRLGARGTGKTSPNFLAHWFFYDYEVCEDQQALQEAIKYINHHGYDLVCVTQDGKGVYTVFFRRVACG